MEQPRLTFLDLGKRGSYTLPDNKISLSITKTWKGITLNNAVSDAIRKGDYCYLRVGTTGYTAEVYFIFCKKQTPDSLMVNTKNKRIVFSSTCVVDELVKTLDLGEHTQHLQISGNCANSKEFLTFKVTKP